MKLFYFPQPARAAPARIMLKTAGVDFQDITFKRDEWMSEWKAKSPTGQAPWLELDDGQTLAQSSAINHYIARLTGFLPEDAMAQARTLEIATCVDEAWSTVFPTFKIPDFEERMAARKELISPGGGMYTKLQIVEKLLNRTATPFYLGSEATLADLSVAAFVMNVRSGLLDGIGESTFDDCPRMKAITEKVKENPKVAEVYGS